MECRPREAYRNQGEDLVRMTCKLTEVETCTSGRTAVVVKALVHTGDRLEMEQEDIVGRLWEQMSNILAITIKEANKIKFKRLFVNSSLGYVVNEH